MDRSSGRKRCVLYVFRLEISDSRYLYDSHHFFGCRSPGRVELQDKRGCQKAGGKGREKAAEREACQTEKRYCGGGTYYKFCHSDAV